MNLDFKNLEDLHKRIQPALRAKATQLSRIGYSNIKEENIWDYLSLNIWPLKKGLTLADMVSDIMNLDSLEIKNYIETTKSQ